MSEQNLINSLVTLTVTWSGPFQLDEVIKDFNDGGKSPSYEGPDYGLYQIYGKHILAGSDTLLYIGRNTQQTFSARFSAHREWIEKEEEIQIYLGRIYDRERHLPVNDWEVWVRDVQIAECLLIYKYSPNYNSVSIAESPVLTPYRKWSLNIWTNENVLLRRTLGLMIGCNRTTPSNFSSSGRAEARRST